MRITDLKIENYGPHAGWNPGNGGVAAGLNVIYGPNEAGKSAIRAFIRMVLFGKMRVNAPGAFRFNYTHISGESGAGSVSVEVADGGRYVFHRVEGRPPTVTGDSSGGEDLLQQLIGRIDGTLYQNVFSISLTELESLESLSADAVKDRIYSAGLGLGSVSLPAVLKQLDDERSISTGLWSSRGGMLRTNLRDLKDRRLELLQKAEALSHYEGLTGDIAALRSQIAGLEKRLQTAREKELRYRSINDLRAATGRKAAIEAELAELPDASSFPENGLRRLEEANTAIDSLRKQVAAEDVQDAENRAALEALGTVDSFVNAESTIVRLRSEQRSYADAVRDLPRVEGHLDTTEQEIADGLASLGAGWDEDRLSAFTDRSGATRTVNGAGEALGRARSDLDLIRADSDRAEATLLEATEIEAAAGRTVERLPSVPDESADELRTRAARLDRLRAAVVDLAQLRRGAAAGPTKQPSAPGLKAALVALLKAIGALMGRIFRFGRAAQEPVQATDWSEETPAAIESEISEIAGSLGLGSAPGERQVVEAISETDRAHERRTEFDRERASLEEAAARVERVADAASNARSALEASRAVAQAAEQEWQSCLRALRLPDSLDLSAAHSALGDLNSLREKLKSAREDRPRVQAMQSLISGVEENLKTVLESAGMRSFEPFNAAGALAELDERFETHRDALSRGEALRQQVVSWTGRNAALEAEIKLHESEIAGLINAAGCEHEEAYRSLAAAVSKREELERDLRRIVEDNLALAGTDDDGIISEIKSSSPEKVEAARQSVADEIKLFEVDRGQLREDLGGLEKSRRDAEESNPTAEIQVEIDRLEQLVDEDSRRWAVLTIAKQILDAARTEYQSERQAPLMQKASEHFRRITGGAYDRVEAIMGEEEIQVVESTGRVKSVTELSRGTAEQLYLAMRFAFIDEYAEHSEPVPVLMDDVLVNFDAERSAAASEAIVEFSRDHQVLLLTCHEQTVHGMREAAVAARAAGPEIIRL